MFASMVWDFDPIAFSLWGLEVRWYGLAYVSGYLLVVWMGAWLARKALLGMSTQAFEQMLFWHFVVGIVGGRVGYFVFYQPEVLWQTPLQILRMWEGGMSIHGGVLAVVLFGLWWTRRKKVSYLRVADIVVVPLCLALMLGRIGNFLNGELVGRPTDLPWGMIFPHIDNLPRHPSQLYEAAKNLLLCGVLFSAFQLGAWKKPGLLFALFLGGYGVLRFLVEYVREPEIVIAGFTMGQVLSFGVLGAAFLLALWSGFWHTDPERKS